jgi:hypothetical protein
METGPPDQMNQTTNGSEGEYRQSDKVKPRIPTGVVSERLRLLFGHERNPLKTFSP